MSTEVELEGRWSNRASPGMAERQTGKADIPKATALAARGWGSRLAACVVAFLLIESLTGLWIYLAPFSVASQVQVLLHTAAGLVLVGPYLHYQIIHFRAWFRQTPTAVMILGYGLMGMVLVCTVSGLVLTWQSAAGPKRSETWDLVHLVTGIGTLVLIAAHLVMALQRRLSARSIPEFRRAQGRFLRGGLTWMGVAAAVSAPAIILWPRPAVEFSPPPGYSVPKYSQQFDEYRGSPFAPTYASTESGRLVRPEVLAGSASCGTSGCHEEILAEWQPGAHRFSAMNPPFQQVQKEFAKSREPAETRYCAGCHDPISLFAGAKDIQNMSLEAPGMQEGSSCAVCHSISKVDQRGNADYILTPPRKYIWEATEGWRKLTSDFVIRAYPRQHLADYDRNLLRTPEFCGACHKQFVPEALNRFGVSPAQNQYDEWRKSHWHAGEPAEDLACRDCHMRLVHDSRDPGAGESGDVRRSPMDQAHRHHGFIATNMFMPEVLKLPGWERHVALTREWIRGETVIPEIAEVWPSGPVGTVTIVAPPDVLPGEEAAVRVLVGNQKAGHNLITGPLDFMRAWIHLRVSDETGRTLAEWGTIDPATREICDRPGQLHEVGNARDQGTLVLEGLPLDQTGNLLVRHELWKKAGGKGQRVIFPGYTDNQVYRFHVPPDTRGLLRLTAELNFRRYRQEFLNLVVPTMEEESGVYQPTVSHSSDEVTVPVRRPPASQFARN